MIRISEAIAALLDLVQFRFGVSIEVLNASLRPVRPALQGEFAGFIDETGVRERCLAVLRTGESRVERGPPTPLGIYPVRLDRQVIGLILVSRTAARAPGLPAPADDTDHLQTVGLMARAIIENDLIRTAHLSRESERIRRLQGILRFIGQLPSLGGGRDLMQAVVQAATVWFDLDCRVYHRQPDGAYGLLAALPGVDPNDVKPHIDGPRLRQMVVSRRVSSAGDLEVLSGLSRRGEALVLGAGLDSEVVLVLIGAIDGEVELTFNAIAQAMSGELHFEARSRVAHWQARLTARAAAPGGAAERILLDLIEELCVAVGAAGGRALLQRGDTQRTIASLDASGRPGERLMRADPQHGYQQVVPLANGVQMHLALWGCEAPPDYGALTTIEAWVEALRPWLSASSIFGSEGFDVASRHDELAFERLVDNEVERAKRFDLGLALLLIEPGGTVPGEALVETVRKELRASDLFGTVRGGRMAVVLVHSGPEAVHSVARRIRGRLAMLVNGTQRAAVRLGQAVFSSECRSGDALIAQALMRLDEPVNG